VSLKGYSQQIIFINPDTLTCFTQTESKFLLLKYYQGNEAIELLDNCEQLNFINSGLTAEYKKALANRETLLLLKDSVINEYKLSVVTLEKSNAKKEKQKKVLKSLVYFTLGIIVVESGYLYFKTF